MPQRRIAVLTGGGDAPGLNAVIRAVVRTACGIGWEVLGVADGFEGLFRRDGVMPLTPPTVRGILPRGGTVLGAASRGNPFGRKVMKNGKEILVDAIDEVAAKVKALRVDALVCIGGDGTLQDARRLLALGCPIVGVPKTIDNDLAGTERTFGFDTAVATATDALDRLHTTAESHHRIMVLEVMGRSAGFIALHAGMAGGADMVLIPEIPFRWEALAASVKRRETQGSKFSIAVVAEGAFPAEGQPTVRVARDGLKTEKLGGIGNQMAARLEALTGHESRCTVLGHLQRGGTPTAYDRVLATRYGAAAVRLVESGKIGHLAALRGGEIVGVPLDDAAVATRRADPAGEMVRTARGLGICFGDA